MVWLEVIAVVVGFSLWEKKIENRVRADAGLDPIGGTYEDWVKKYPPIVKPSDSVSASPSIAPQSETGSKT